MQPSAGNLWGQRIRARQDARAHAPSTKLPTTWHPWLEQLFPNAFGFPHAHFAEHHTEFWEWVWGLEPATRPNPFIGVWPRSGGKTTSVECAVVAVGARGKRKNVLIVSETQAQADKIVANIAARLESRTVEASYPSLAERKLNKYGSSRGWRRERLTTASGFTVQGSGLEGGIRGLREEDDRPDLIVFDDIDSKLDTPKATERKIAILTTSILPAGSPDVAILGVQNLIIPHGIFSRLAEVAEEQADFLTNRHVSGPHPAIRGLETEQVYDAELGRTRTLITGGTATWEGQDLAKCQEQLDDEGLTSFLQERQHEVADIGGGMYAHVDFVRCEWSQVPTLERTVLWVDPAVTNTDDSDSMGIQADALGADGKIYRLYSWEQRTTPEDALRRAILKAVELGAEHVGVETDQGGDTWRSVYARAADALVAASLVTRQQVPPFESAKAGAGHGSKLHRQQQVVLTEYERGMVVHVRGTHDALERSLKRFGVKKPFDLADAGYYSIYTLRKPPRAPSGAVFRQAGKPPPRRRL